MNKVETTNKDFYIGLIYAFILVFCQFEPPIGLPLILIGSTLYFSTKNISKDYLQLSYLFIAKIILMTAIFLMFKFQYGFSYLALRISTDLIMLCLLFFNPSNKFINGFINGIIILFFVNLLFNIYLFFNGFDPLGRELYTRTGESLPRFSGVFGHPYFSTYISFLGLIISVLKKSKVFMTISLLSCLFTGSFRSWTLTGTFIVSYFSLKNFSKNKVFTIMIFLAIISIALIFYFAYEGNANFLRVFAWQNSLQKILQNPILGYHNFAYYRFDGEIEAMNTDVVLSLGLAENQYLQFMQDNGILVGVLHLLIYIKIFTIVLNRFYKNQNNHLYFTQGIFACVAFSDTFYGGLMENILLATIFSVFALKSLSDNPKNSLRNY